MKIIVISGKAQSGKDTIASVMQIYLKLKGYETLIVHYADLLKYICTKFLEWDGIKDEKGRTLLQYVGTDIIRKQKPDYWVDFIIDILKFFPEHWDYVLIPDCRFRNEIDKLKESEFNVKHLEVVRPNYESCLTPEQKQHVSEREYLNNTDTEQIINDSTLAELIHKATKWIKNEIKNGA